MKIIFINYVIDLDLSFMEKVKNKWYLRHTANAEGTDD